MSDDRFEERLEKEMRAYLAAGMPDGSAPGSLPPRRNSVKARTRLPVGAVAAFALILLGATTLIGPGRVLLPAQRTPPASEAANTTPSSQPAATTHGTPSHGASQTPDTRSEKERSDRYWAEVAIFGRFALTYDSLRDITDDAHLVVVGRFSSQVQGDLETFSSGTLRPTMITTILVDEVLKGEAASRSPGSIEIAALGSSSFADSELPSEQMIFFLKSMAQWRLDEGVPPASDPNDQFYYVRPNGYQCVLREIDGLVDVIEGFSGWEDDIGPFPSQLDGQDFEAVVDRIRGIIAE